MSNNRQKARQMRPDLVEFQTNQPRYKGSCGRNGRDDLPRNLLGRVSIGNGYVVIHSTEIGSGGDEVDMMVGIVILLEFDWSKAVSRQRGR